MTTSVTAAGRPAPGATAVEWLTQWVKDHKRAAAYIAAVLAIASRNYQLAASVLSQVTENYAGTHAAQEGTILLAQVRLAQGQSRRAVDVLKTFAPQASRDYRAQAYGLLGGAYENTSRPRDAADAYQRAADAAPYPFLRAQFLSDAGRAWLAAGDTAKAIAAYQTIARQLDSTSAAVEAKVRIGELTKGATAGAIPR